MQKETSLVSDSMALAAGEGSQRVSGELRPRPEEAGMNYEDLTSDMQDKVRACKSTEELMALAEEEGYELSDEELQQVSGGWGPDDYQEYCSTRMCSWHECHSLYCNEVSCRDLQCGHYDYRTKY